MTHDELLAKVIGTSINVANSFPEIIEEHLSPQRKALRAVVQLHKPIYDNSCFDLDCCGGPYPNLCDNCEDDYPCATIQAIEKELV